MRNNKVWKAQFFILEKQTSFTGPLLLRTVHSQNNGAQKIFLKNGGIRSVVNCPHR